MRKFILLAVWMLLGFSLSQTALAEEGILLFGPETFTRAKGKPVTEVKTFSVLEPSIETTLNIINGDTEGNSRVSSAEVYLNNELVVGPNRFNQRVGSISVPVVLADGENKIAVELRSKPESFISINITSPNITIGSEGGTILTTAGIRVEISPGALSKNTIITIDTLTEETLPAPVPEGWELLGAANFQPDGLTFNVPVTITIPLNIALAPGTYVALFTFDPETNTYVHTREYGIVDETWSFVSFEADHFSFWGSFLDPRIKAKFVGQVVTKDGAPVAKATVTITIIDAGGNIVDSLPATTREDGFFAAIYRTLDTSELIRGKFRVKAVTPWGATGETDRENIEMYFNLESFVATLLGVPTNWPELANFVIKLLAQAAAPPNLYTPSWIGWGGGVKIEVVAEAIQDTCVHSDFPDINFSRGNGLGVDFLGYVPRELRTFFKLSANKTLHIYCYSTNQGPLTIAVYEINPAAFDIGTVTWNNQPSPGSLVTTFTPTEGAWSAISTGTTGAILLKTDGAVDGSAYFYSIDWPIGEERPYVTDK